MRKQKEMLVELLKEALPENPLRGNNCTCRFPDYEQIAERLLDRVVVLPYKIGTTLYVIKLHRVFDDSVVGNVRSEYCISKIEYTPTRGRGWRYAFTNKKEAESKLEELNKELRKERGY